MAAMLQLPRADGFALDVPDDPALCETCRELPAGASRYCSELCAAFDAALDELRDAYTAADGDRTAPAVVIARARLREVAERFDAVHLAD